MSAVERPPRWGEATAALPGQYRLIRVTTDAEMAAVLALRQRVFGDEQRIVDASVTDPDDARSLHALAFAVDAAGDHPVGTGRLTLDFGERGEALIAWVATAPEARGRGIGSATMRFLIAAADEAGAPVVLLSAQIHAEPFYRRLGFAAAGDPFLVKGIEHRWMARRHPGTPRDSDAQSR